MKLPLKHLTIAIIVSSFICLFTACSKKSNPVLKSTIAVVSTFAGNNIAGAVNGIGVAASFYYPTGVAVDATGNVYVADFDNDQIRKINASGSVSLFAGNNTTSNGLPISGSANGVGTMASFSNPYGVAVDMSGNVFVADKVNGLVRKIDPEGTVSTLAGNTHGPGFADGMGAAASFNWLSGVAVDKSDNVYVADYGNNMIRKISPSGNVSTIAGNGKVGADNGDGNLASFNEPSGLAVDASGNVYVADFGNNQIRKINPNGEVSTFAGNLNMGYADGMGIAASFNHPSSVAIDISGNLYVADDGNSLVRKINPAGIVTTIAGSKTLGSANGIGTTASFHYPLGIAVDASGNLYIADSFNNQIRKIELK
jgi:serine/threonine-protein kinase